MTDQNQKFTEKTMLFRTGSEQVIWDIALDTIEVDAFDVEEHLAEGWFKHPFEARDAAESTKVAEAAAALELKTKLAEEAVALGVKVDGRWSAERLQDAINEAKNP